MHSARTCHHFAFYAFALLAATLLAYWRALSLPLISDDYLVIGLSRSYGEPGGWTSLASDALYRCRALFMILTYWMDRTFGLIALPYNVAGVLLHFANCLLVLALGSWDRIGWRLSVPAAFFFALYHGHQEAVIWYSARPDQMVFLFVVAGVLVWIRYLRAPSSKLYVAALMLFAAALASKESGVVLVGLLVIVTLADRIPIKRSIALIAPFAVIAVAYFAAGYLARTTHLHYNDGTFALGPHFLLVLTRSMARMLWAWGAIALALLAWLGWKTARSTIAVGLSWMAIALLPYSFLTYMPHVPSRHTYMASAGLALIAAAAFRCLLDYIGNRRAIAMAIVAVFAVAECGYLWTRKHRQFVERAAPTEELIRATRDFRGEVVLHCFPYSDSIAESTLKVNHGDRVRMRADRHADSTSCGGGSAFELIGN